jgi:hypothetical protein
MIELLSIHIPKTAGQSFGFILRKTYGVKKVFQVTRQTGKQWEGGLRDMVPAGTRVLHGHFTFANVASLCRRENVRVLTWLRDPVERILSNYYYFLERARSGARPWNAHRREEGLLEYAGREENRDRMSRFLSGAELRELFFVGIVECFEEDLRELSALLGWRQIQPARVNDNRLFKSQFSTIGEDMRGMIKNLNPQDIRLYQQALDLRAARRKETAGAAI